MPVGTITFPTTIDSEETLSGAANNVTVLLDQAINSSQTTIAVADTTFFPAAGFATIVDNLTTPTKIEIISYTSISGNTLTSVIRGAQGTTPQSFAAGYVEIRPTAGHHQALVDAVIAIENRLGTGSTLALNKGGTGRAFTVLPGTDRIFFWDASANSMQLLELGTNLSITGTVLNATGGAGPAADVIIGLGMPNIFSVTPASITNNGVFDVQFVSQTANTVLVGPINAPAAAPTFRLLEDEDIPNVLTIHKNRHLTTNGFFKTTNGDGTYAVDTNTYLTGNQTVTLSGDVTGSGATSITTTIANGAVTYGKLQNISATSRVLGRKTAGAGSTEELTFSEVLDFVGSAAQGDILYRGSTGWARLAAGTSGQYLQTQGAAANPQWATVAAGGTPGGSSGDYQINSAGSFGPGVLAESSGRLTATPTASTTGSTRYLRVLTPADTALTASTEAIGIQFGGNTSVTTVTRQFSAGALTAQREYLFVAPTYSFTSASTLTTAATVAIGSISGFTGSSGMPVAGTNATITNRIALFVDGLLNVGTTTTTDPILGTQMTGANIAMDTAGNTRFFVGSRSSNDTWCGVQGSVGVWMIQHNAGPGFHVGTYGSAAWGLMTNNTTRIAIATNADGGVVGINKSSGYGGQLHVVSGSASRVALRADSAASPTADIAQFTVNGTLGAAVNKDARIILAERSTDPAAADLTSGANAKDQIAVYMKNDKLVFAYNDAGTVYYISIPCDGATATTTWTHSTTAP